MSSCNIYQCFILHSSPTLFISTNKFPSFIINHQLQKYHCTSFSHIILQQHFFFNNTRTYITKLHNFQVLLPCLLMQNIQIYISEIAICYKYQKKKKKKNRTMLIWINGISNCNEIFHPVYLIPTISLSSFPMKNWLSFLVQVTRDETILYNSLLKQILLIKKQPCVRLALADLV